MRDERRQVASLPHTGHFYATTLPRLTKGSTLAVFGSETLNAADISSADRFRNAGRVGGYGDSWGAGGTTFNVLGRQRRLDVS